MPDCSIRKSTDIAPTYGSPWLIAVSHVLHRLSVPRHSPCALCSLTILNVFQKRQFDLKALRLCRHGILSYVFALCASLGQVCLFRFLRHFLLRYLWFFVILKIGCFHNLFYPYRNCSILTFVNFFPCHASLLFAVPLITSTRLICSAAFWATPQLSPRRSLFPGSEPRRFFDV